MNIGSAGNEAHNRPNDVPGLPQSVTACVGSNDVQATEAVVQGAPVERRGPSQRELEEIHRQLLRLKEAMSVSQSAVEAAQGLLGVTTSSQSLLAYKAKPRRLTNESGEMSC